MIFPDVGDAVNSVVNQIAEALWKFTGAIQSTVFTVIDSHTRPRLMYSEGGPLGVIYPITLWIGLFLAVAFGIAQAGRVAWNGGEGIAATLKGIALWAIASAVGLTTLDLVASAASSASAGIIDAGFSAENWSGLNSDTAFFAAGMKNLEGIALGLMSLLVTLPFAFGLLVLVLIREGGLLILTATWPILCAGLIHERFGSWFWKGLRWMASLIFMLPVVAIAMVIGRSIAMSAGTGSSTGVLDDLGTALVGGVIANISLVSPLVLFKLFSFVDPNTGSGVKMRSGLGAGSLPVPSFGKGGSAGALGGGLAGAAGGGDSDDDSGDDDSGNEAALMAAGAALGGPAGAAAATGGGGAAGGSGAGGLMAGDGAGGLMAGGGSPLSGGQLGVLGAMKQGTGRVGGAVESGAGQGVGVMDAVGAGHYGGPAQPAPRSGSSSSGEGSGDFGSDPVSGMDDADMDPTRPLSGDVPGPADVSPGPLEEGVGGDPGPVEDGFDEARGDGTDAPGFDESSSWVANQEEGPGAEPGTETANEGDDR